MSVTPQYKLLRTIIPTFLIVQAFVVLANGGEPKPLYRWDVNAAKDDAGTITVPEKIAGADIVVEAGNGVTLVDTGDSSVGKSLSFEGSQKKALSPVSKVAGDSNMEISFKLKLSEEPRERAQMILQGCGISIYASREGPLHFGVASTGGATPTEVVAPVSTGMWVTITAIVKGSAIELQAEDKSVTGSLRDGAVFEPTEDTIRIGGDSSSGGLVGEIADIKISPTGN
jgi:hypothetical protein